MSTDNEALVQRLLQTLAETNTLIAKEESLRQNKDHLVYLRARAAKLRALINEHRLDRPGSGLLH
jgi:hypothetical protein